MTGDSSPRRINWQNLATWFLGLCFMVMAWGFNSWAETVREGIKELRVVSQNQAIITTKLEQLVNDVSDLRAVQREHEAAEWHEGAGRAIIQLQTQTQRLLIPPDRRRIP